MNIYLLVAFSAFAVIFSGLLGFYIKVVKNKKRIEELEKHSTASISDMLKAKGISIKE